MAVVAGVTWFAGSGPGPRDDWRGAVALVGELYRPPICVLMPGTGGAKVLRYYLRTPVDCLIFGSGPQPVDPRRVPSDLVFLVVYSTRGRSVEAVAADLRQAFPPPVWQVNGSIPFRGIEVVSVSRNR